MLENRSRFFTGASLASALALQSCLPPQQQAEILSRLVTRPITSPAELNPQTSTTPIDTATAFPIPEATPNFFQSVHAIDSAQFTPLPSVPSFDLSPLLNYDARQMDPKTQDTLQKASVLVTVNFDGISYVCSGFHLGNGDIGTAYHCFDHGTVLSASIQTPDGIKHPGFMVHHFEGIDAAILQVPANLALPALTLAPAADMKPGEMLHMNGTRSFPDGGIDHHLFRGNYLGQSVLDTASEHTETLNRAFMVSIGNYTGGGGYSGSPATTLGAEVRGALIYGNEDDDHTDNFIPTAHFIRSEVFMALLQRIQ